MLSDLICAAPSVVSCLQRQGPAVYSFSDRGSARLHIQDGRTDRGAQPTPRVDSSARVTGRNSRKPDSRTTACPTSAGRSPQDPTGSGKYESRNRLRDFQIDRNSELPL